jgi:hypothetical protein
MSETDAWLDIGNGRNRCMVRYWICQKQMHGYIYWICQKQMHGWILDMSETDAWMDIVYVGDS